MGNNTAHIEITGFKKARLATLEGGIALWWFDAGFDDSNFSYFGDHPSKR